MGKILVVAEKPSVGRDIAGVLGCKTKGDGFLSGEKYIVSLWNGSRSQMERRHY